MTNLCYKTFFSRTNCKLTGQFWIKNFKKEVYISWKNQLYMGISSYHCTIPKNMALFRKGGAQPKMIESRSKNPHHLGFPPNHSFFIWQIPSVTFVCSEYSKKTKLKRKIDDPITRLLIVSLKLFWKGSGSS